MDLIDVYILKSKLLIIIFTKVVYSLGYNFVQRLIVSRFIFLKQQDKNTSDGRCNNEPVVNGSYGRR